MRQRKLEIVATAEFVVLPSDINLERVAVFRSGNALSLLPRRQHLRAHKCGFSDGKLSPIRTRAARLPHAVGPQQDAQGLKHDGCIPQQAEIFDVEEIVFELALGIFHRCAVAIVDLCPARQSGAHAMTQRIQAQLAGELIDEAGPLGAWSDDRHIVPKYVQKLRNLVETGCAVGPIPLW